MGPRLPEIISGFRLRQAQVDFLEDPEIEFAHRSGRRLSLADIFVNPDFTILSPDQADPTLDEGKLMRGDRFDSLLREKKKLLILGRERSGRTSLAKKIFWTLFREGIVPVIVLGDRLKGSKLEEIDDLVRKAVTSTYDQADLTFFDHTDRSKRALIIDGFENARMTARQRASLLNHMEETFETIVAFGNPLMMVEEVTSGLVHEEALPAFTRLEVRELGRAARRRMIRRWHSIGARGDYSLIEEKAIESERIIDTLLGKSFLPAYPVFVLSFLQSIESSRPMDNIGSYGYHYEAFITNALSQHSAQISLDIKYQFLSELAYHLLSQHLEEVDEQELITFYKDYCEKYGIDPDRGQLVSGLLESRLLEFFDDAYRFKYSYAYYFFVARYFRDHIDEEVIRTHIREFGRNLHVERNANIWIFLAHLTKNPFLIQTILEEAQGLFAEFQPVALEDDVKFLRELSTFVPKLTLPSTTPEQNIEAHYDQLDTLDSKEPEKESPAELEEARQLLRKLDAWIKTVQVLGQVLKNFPGSLTATQKFNVVNEAITLGLRGLAFFLQIFDEGKEDMFRFFEERVAQRFGGSPSDEELQRRVRNGLFWFVRVTIFGTIKLISHGVGAKGEEATYSKVVGALGTNAAKLLEISIALDTLKIPKQKILHLYAEFKDDLLNRHLVESLVARHLYLFPVPNNVKDELCRKLGIAVEKLDRIEGALGEHTKRIGGPARAGSTSGSKNRKRSSKRNR